MTDVIYVRDGERYMITADGHAGDTESCNYINGILWALAGYVTNAEARRDAQSVTLETESGHMEVSCTGNELVGAVYEAALIGLLQLEKARPDTISVEFRQGN